MAYKSPYGSNSGRSKKSPYASSSGAKPFFIKSNGATASSTTKSGENPLWTLLNSLSSVGGAVKQQVYNWTDNKLDWKDIPLAESIAQGAKGQLNAWKDGAFDLQDVPAVGFLSSIGKESVTGKKLLQDRFGMNDWKDQKLGQVDHWWQAINPIDIAGLGVDIFTDPLSYVSGGGAAAVKAGKYAINNAVLNKAAELGLNVSKRSNKVKMVDDLVEQATAKRVEYYKNKGVTDGLLNRFADDFGSKLRNDMLNVGKQAREATQNKLFGISAPFSNKVATFGSKPNMFKIKDALVDTAHANEIAQKFKDLGYGEVKAGSYNPVTKTWERKTTNTVDDYLKKTYGVNSISEMTSQMNDHFLNNLPRAVTRPLDNLSFKEVTPKEPKIKLGSKKVAEPKAEKNVLKSEKQVSEELKAPKATKVKPEPKIEVSSLGNKERRDFYKVDLHRKSINSNIQKLSRAVSSGKASEQEIKDLATEIGKQLDYHDVQAERFKNVKGLKVSDTASLRQKVTGLTDNYTQGKITEARKAARTAEQKKLADEAQAKLDAEKQARVQQEAGKAVQQAMASKETSSALSQIEKDFGINQPRVKPTRGRKKMATPQEILNEENTVVQTTIKKAKSSAKNQESKRGRKPKAEGTRAVDKRVLRPQRVEAFKAEHPDLAERITKHGDEAVFGERRELSRKAIIKQLDYLDRKSAPKAPKANKAPKAPKANRAQQAIEDTGKAIRERQAMQAEQASIDIEKPINKVEEVQVPTPTSTKIKEPAVEEKVPVIEEKRYLDIKQYAKLVEKYRTSKRVREALGIDRDNKEFKKLDDAFRNGQSTNIKVELPSPKSNATSVEKTVTAVKEEPKPDTLPAVESKLQIPKELSTEPDNKLKVSLKDIASLKGSDGYIPMDKVSDKIYLAYAGKDFETLLENSTKLEMGETFATNAEDGLTELLVSRKLPLVEFDSKFIKGNPELEEPLAKELWAKNRATFYATFTNTDLDFKFNPLGYVKSVRFPAGSIATGSSPASRAAAFFGAKADYSSYISKLEGLGFTKRTLEDGSVILEKSNARLAFNQSKAPAMPNPLDRDFKPLIQNEQKYLNTQSRLDSAAQTKFNNYSTEQFDNYINETRSALYDIGITIVNPKYLGKDAEAVASVTRAIAEQVHATRKLVGDINFKGLKFEVSPIDNPDMLATYLKATTTIRVSKNGRFSIAHEIGHFLADRMADKTGMEDVIKSLKGTEQFGKAMGKISKSNLAYWKSGNEVFARAFEEAVLHQTGIKTSLRAAESLGLNADQVSQVMKAVGVNEAWADDVYREGRDFLASKAKQVPTFNQVITGQTFGKKALRFQQDMGGRTDAMRFVTASKLFNSRSVGSKNSFVDTFGKDISLTNVELQGGKQRLVKDLTHMDKLAKGMTQSELESIAFVVEDAFPRGMSKSEYFKANGIDGNGIKRVQNFADEFSKIMSELGVDEREVGLLKELRRNYFPHIYELSDAEAEAIFKEMASDPKLKGLRGRSQKNGFANERKGFQTMAELSNYLDDLGKKIAEETDPKKVTKLTERRDMLQKALKMKPIDTLAKRYSTSIRSVVNKRVYSKLEKNGLIVRKGTTTTRDDLVKIDNREKARLLGLEVGDRIQKDIFEGLKRMDSIFTDEGLNKFLGELDAVHSIWKRAITTVIPRHYVTNMIGHIFNNALAGVDISSYTESGRILRSVKKGTVSAEDKKLIKFAQQRGVIGQGFLADFKRFVNYGADTERFGDKLANSVGKTANGLTLGLGSKYVHGLEKVGQTSDDYARLAHFIDVYKKTGNMDLAADSVKKYLFNYRELSTADRVIRAGAIPFWTWMRNNIPLQLEKLFSEPRFALSWLKLKESMQGEVTQSDAPAWANQSGFIVGNYVYNPQLPLTDLSRVIASPKKVLQEIGSSLNPTLRMPTEIALNKQFFNDKEISPSWSENPNKDYFNYIAKNAGPIGAIPTKQGANIFEELRKLIVPGITQHTYPKEGNK